MVKDELKEIRDIEDLPSGLKPFFHKSFTIDAMKNHFLEYINGQGGETFLSAGIIFEQVIAQSLRVNQYHFAYHYQGKPKEEEIEFLLTADHSAIEVKSGGFSDYSSSKQYASRGNKVYFLTMMPYVGNDPDLPSFKLLPVYSVCILNENDLQEIKFIDVDRDALVALSSGKLPRTPGFFLSP